MRRPGVIGAVVALGVLSACSASEQPSAPEPTVTTPGLPALAGTAAGMARALPAGEAETVLETLPVKGRAPLTGYTREAFGPDWADVNGNGCDTRNDILARDLTGTEVADCVVMSGMLVDPYSGARVRFVRGPVSSMEVQIDHVVALANAWQTGAFRWDDDKRERFANDPRNLLAVRGDLNLQKGDGDTATWLPPKRSFRCDYVRRQIDVKATYDLWLTAAEKAAMQRVLASC